MIPAEEIASLRYEIKMLKTDLSSLRAQLLKARQQRHDAHNQLRAVLANRRNQAAAMTSSTETSPSSPFLTREEAWKALQDAAKLKYGQHATAVEIEAETIGGEIQPVSLQHVIVHIPADHQR